MAADADAPNGELSEKAAKAPSPPSSDRTDDGSPVSPDESEPTTAGEAADGDVGANDGGSEEGSEDGTPVKPRMSHLRLAAIIGLAMVVALSGTVGWLGYRAISVAPGPGPAAAVCSGRAAVRAESDDDRLAARRGRCSACSGLGYGSVLRPVLQTQATFHRRGQEGAVEVGGNDHRSGPGIRFGRQSTNACRRVH